MRLKSTAVRWIAAILGISSLSMVVLLVVAAVQYDRLQQAKETHEREMDERAMRARNDWIRQKLEADQEKK